MTLTEFLLARISEDESAALDTQWLALEYGVDSYGREAFANRVMPECEAKRRIVESFAAGEPYQRGADAYAITGMVLRLLALPYADHPDYREDWRP